MNKALKFNTVNVEPTTSSPDGLYATKEGGDAFNLALVNNGSVRRLRSGSAIKEYSLFPDETENTILPIIRNSSRGLILRPAPLGAVSAIGIYVPPAGEQTSVGNVQYHILPGRTYSVTFYANRACGVYALSNYYWDSADTVKRCIYSIPSDIGSVQQQTFVFTAGEYETYIIFPNVFSEGGGGDPIVQGNSSKYLRYLPDGEMELAPVGTCHHSVHNIEMRLIDLTNSAIPYPSPGSYPMSASLFAPDSYFVSIYKLAKGKLYDLRSTKKGTAIIYTQQIIAVLNKSDMQILAQPPASNKYLFQNSRIQDCVWNERSHLAYLSERSTDKKGFANYLCDSDDKYLLISGASNNGNYLQVVEKTKAFGRRLYSYSPSDLQEFTHRAPLGRIDLNDANLPTSLSAPAVRMTAAIDVGGRKLPTPVDISVQGHSTATLPAKGFTMDVLTDDASDSRKLRFGAWRPFDSFYLKAYMNDVTKCRDIAANRLYEQMILTRTKGRQRDWERAGQGTEYETGALGHIDGVPFELYNNGQYWGLYTLCIKKNRANYNMDKNNNNQIWVDVGSATLGAGQTPYPNIELRNPSISGYSEGQTPPDGAVKTAVDSFWNWQSESNWATYTRSDIEAKLDVVSVIDVFLLHLVVNAWDNVANNMFFTTYDGGNKWFYVPYDYNDAWGKFGTASELSTDYVDSMALRFDFVKVTKLYFEEVRYRWSQLVKEGVMTHENIMNIFNTLLHQFGEDGIQAFLKRWNITANQVANSGLQQIDKYVSIILSSLDSVFDPWGFYSEVKNTDLF